LSFLAISLEGFYLNSLLYKYDTCTQFSLLKIASDSHWVSLPIKWKWDSDLRINQLPTTNTQHSTYHLGTISLHPTSQIIIRSDFIVVRWRHVLLSLSL
jgi:hypothetical protein